MKKLRTFVLACLGFAMLWACWAVALGEPTGNSAVHGGRAAVPEPAGCAAAVCQTTFLHRHSYLRHLLQVAAGRRRHLRIGESLRPARPVEDPPGHRPDDARHPGRGSLHASGTLVGRHQVAVLFQGGTDRQHQHLRDWPSTARACAAFPIPTPTCNCYKGSNGGQHDIAPAYLPDGRIVFLSTRPSGLVPCANEGVSILHVMNADGSDLHAISVNNVNEFDPSVLPDGRILFGRWEYVDKNALTIQSLWTVNPDGTQETAFYANNMVFPEAILDARPVPDSHLVVGTFAKHNSTPRGSIALVDPRMGKNDPRASTNLEHPEDPTFDRGDSCEPWPVTAQLFLFSGRPAGSARNVLELIDPAGHRAVLLSDPDICLHSPMLIKPRPRPPVITDSIDRQARTGRFFLQDGLSRSDGP